jgi:hypothetical protein
VMGGKLGGLASTSAPGSQPRRVPTRSGSPPPSRTSSRAPASASTTAVSTPSRAFPASGDCSLGAVGARRWNASRRVGRRLLHPESGSPLPSSRTEFSSSMTDGRVRLVRDLTARWWWSTFPLPP